VAQVVEHKALSSNLSIQEKNKKQTNKQTKETKILRECIQFHDYTFQYLLYGIYSMINNYDTFKKWSFAVLQI
jgi:hypothetical protein